MKKMKKRKRNKRVEVIVNKIDSVGLFSGKYRSQVFKDKKDKLDQISRKDKSKKYEDYI